jgi:Na+/H+ antiporter NhaD/arsenite permease-like protein
MSVAALNHSAADWTVVAIFATVYLGMFLGGLPRLKLDRSGVALLGAIAVMALTGLPLQDAALAVDLPTIVLLFAFMVVQRKCGWAVFTPRSRAGWAAWRCRAGACWRR